MINVNMYTEDAGCTLNANKGLWCWFIVSRAVRVLSWVSATLTNDTLQSNIVETSLSVSISRIRADGCGCKKTKPLLNQTVYLLIFLYVRLHIYIQTDTEALGWNLTLHLTLISWKGTPAVSQLQSPKPSERKITQDISNVSIVSPTR